MSRIRSIKPDFWDDEKLASVSRDARLLFIGLWNHADDEGRMRANPRFVQSKVFPYDVGLDCRPLLDELARKRFICIYTAEGQEFLWIVNFKRHQKIDRPQASNLPAPPEECCEDHARPFDEDSTNVRGSIVAGMERERSGEEWSGEGTLPRGALAPEDLRAVASSPESTAFHDFMQIYPIKTGREPANREFRKRYPSLDKQAFALAKLRAQISAGVAITEEARWWIRDGRENDPIEPVPKKAGRKSATDEAAEELEREHAQQAKPP